MLLVALLGAAVLGALVLSYFLHLEARGRRHVVLAIVVASLLVEAMLNRSEYTVPVGLFRISVGGYDVRPTDLLIGLAVLARFLSSDTVRRIPVSAMAWIAFLLWYSWAAVAGVMYGTDVNDVVFQGKAIYYLSAVVVLAAGTSFAPFVRPGAFGGWAKVLGISAAFALVTGVARLHWSVEVGPLRLPDLGRVNNDAISLLVAGGAVLLAVEGTRAQRRWWVGAIGVLCLLTPFSSDQRASYLGLAATLGVILVAAGGNTWRRRVRATPTEAMLMLGGLAALGVGVMSFGGRSVDVVTQLEATFFASEQAASADSRRDLWGEAFEQVSDAPVFGQGVGVLSPVRIKGYTEDDFLTSHNIFLDVATRAGLVGALLLVVALLLTLADATRAWLRHPDDQLAALALGMAAIVMGIVAKGMVESTFEKYRLNVALALAIGAIMALRAEADRRRGEEPADVAAELAPPVA